MRNPFRPPSAKIPRQPTCLVFIKRTSFSMTNTIIANQPQEWANLPDLVALLPNLVIGCKAIRYDTMCIAAIFHYAWKQRMQCAARTCNFREIVLLQLPLKFCPLAGLCEVFMKAAQWCRLNAVHSPQLAFLKPPFTFLLISDIISKAGFMYLLHLSCQ